ncbi:MAG: 50S ribosomal protein L24 [Candidatus Woesearchaeota archaeon]|nr:50S ribosomal protein L24 [Candidatus Woesearchaeota archaeon]
MKAEWKNVWKSSKQPRKQRKYRINAPLHIRQKFMRSGVSKELHKKYGVRNVRVRTGDKVKIITGQFKKKSGKVESIDLKKGKLKIAGIENIKKDGSKTLYSFDPSNIVIEELDLNDKKRREKLEKGRKNESTSQKTTESK